MGDGNKIWRMRMAVLPIFCIVSIWLIVKCLQRPLVTHDERQAKSANLSEVDSDSKPLETASKLETKSALRKPQARLNDSPVCPQVKRNESSATFSACKTHLEWSNTLRTLPQDIPENIVAELQTVLSAPEREFAKNLTGEESHAIRSYIIDILLRQTHFPESLPDLLAAVARDGNDQDAVWRGYCIQAIPDCAARLQSESARAKQSAVLKSFLKVKDGNISGTALLGLARMESWQIGGVTPESVGNAAVQLACDTYASDYSRSTAFGIAAAYCRRDVLPAARHVLNSPKSLSLNIAAVTAIGDIGEFADIYLLQSLAADGGILGKAASAAAKRLASHFTSEDF